VCGNDIHIEPQMVPSLDSLGSCCCMKNQPMANSFPNYQDVPSHKLLAYFPEFDLLSQFGHPSVDDRLNYGLSESQGKHAVVHRSEQQTMTLDRRRSSLELHADITHERYRFQHTSPLGTWYERVRSEQIW
jgi:hypothetical protein